MLIQCICMTLRICPLVDKGRNMIDMAVFEELTASQNIDYLDVCRIPYNKGLNRALKDYLV